MEELKVTMTFRGVDKEFLRKFLELTFKDLIPEWVTIDDIRPPLTIKVIMPKMES